MLDPLFQYLDKIVTDFSWKRIGLLLFITIYLIFMFLLFEQNTSYFMISRLERSTSLLKELHELNDNHILSGDKELEAIFNGIKRELLSSSDQSSFILDINPIILKGLAGAAPWILIALAYIPGIFRKEKDSSDALFGMFIFAVIFGGIGMLIPSSLGYNINYLLYPIGHFLLAVIAILIWQSKKKSKS